MIDSFKPFDIQQMEFFPPKLTLSLLYQDLSATLLCKLGPGQSEIAEELCQRLQRKERMLQDLLSDRNKQVVEYEMEIQGLLQSMSSREQESQVRTNAQSRRVPLSAFIVRILPSILLVLLLQSINQTTVLHQSSEYEIFLEHFAFGGCLNNTCPHS